MKKLPLNLTIHPLLEKAARDFVNRRKKTCKGFSVSRLVEDSLVAKLRKVGVKLPAEFTAKAGA